MHKLVFPMWGAVLLVACGSSDADDAAPQDGAVDGNVVGDTRIADSLGGDVTLDGTEVTADTATSDATAIDSGLDATAGACGDKTCVAGQICARSYTTGGACLDRCSDDAATCPTGTHCESTCCVRDERSYTYSCEIVPTDCASALTCDGSCGASLCSGGCPCETATDTLVTCHCLAP